MATIRTVANIQIMLSAYFYMLVKLEKPPNALSALQIQRLRDLGCIGMVFVEVCRKGFNYQRFPCPRRSTRQKQDH